MIKSNKISSIIVMLAALLIALPLSGDAQSITRNKKQQTVKTTIKSKQSSSSSSGEKPKKTSKTTQKSSTRSNGMTKTQKSRIIQQAIDDMVYVEGGTFTMGATSEQGSDASPNEKPIHQVTLSGFYISKYEVTQALWLAVMGRNPSEFKGNMNCPVENVSWNDCQDFINRLNRMTGRRFRLPTEAEWEYAARGANRSRGYKYSGSDDLGSVAWYTDNSGGTTHPVGQKLPNELGLYDMSGNVREWCQDWFGSYSSDTQTNPTGPTMGFERVRRGGNCYYDSFCRITFRDLVTPSYIGIGLRLAMSL